MGKLRLRAVEGGRYLIKVRQLIDDKMNTEILRLPPIAILLHKIHLQNVSICFNSNNSWAYLNE